MGGGVANRVRSFKTFSLPASLFTLALAAAPLACSDGTPGGNVAANTGNVGLSLTAHGVSLQSVSYVITGAGSYAKSGSIDVSHSTTVASVIPAIPAGSGYTIALSATPTAGAATCSGAAPFSVTAGQTTPVNIDLLCHEAPTTGSVFVNGTVNLCPVLNDVSASPAAAAVGGSVALTSNALDVDNAPSALSYQWTATSGTLSGANSNNAALLCTSSATITVTVTVSDGDPKCVESDTVTVTCGNGTSSGGTGGAGGMSSSGGAAGTTSAGGMTSAGGTTSAAGTTSSGGSGASGGTAGAGGTAAAGAGAGGQATGTGGAGAGGASAGASGAGGASAGTGGASAGTGGVSGAGAGGAGAGGSGGTSPARDLVIYRVGTGTGSLINTGNPVFIDEYSATGAFVKSTALPTAASGANKALVASGTASSEGLITLSSDEHYVMLTGYAATPPVSGLAGTTSATVPRVVGRLDAAGNVDTTTALTDWASANNPRSVASSNGTDIWVGGAAGGVRYTTLGASTSLQLNTATPNVANIRQVSIFGSQLYASDSSGSTFRLSTIGTGLPTTANQTETNLAAFPTSTGSPYAFFFADLDGNPGVDTLYVADDNNSASSAAGITKYALVGGNWTAEGTVGVANDAYRGLTGVVSSGTVTLFAVRKGGTTATGGGELVTLVDASGQLGTLTGTPALLATAGANQAFRGIALAPLP